MAQSCSDVRDAAIGRVGQYRVVQGLVGCVTPFLKNSFTAGGVVAIYGLTSV